MYKDIMQRDLIKIWQRWLVAEYNMLRLEFLNDEPHSYLDSWFQKFDDTYNIEEFLWKFSVEKKCLSQTQKDFANHLLQVMVEIQNHDNIQESWDIKKRVSNG